MDACRCGVTRWKLRDYCSRGRRADGQPDCGWAAGSRGPDEAEHDAGRARPRRASARGLAAHECARQAPSRREGEAPAGEGQGRSARCCQCGEDRQPKDAIGAGSPGRRCAEPRASRPTGRDQAYVGGFGHGHHRRLCRAGECGSAPASGNPADEGVDGRHEVAGRVEPDTVRHHHEQRRRLASDSSKPRKRAYARGRSQSSLTAPRSDGLEMIAK